MRKRYLLRLESEGISTGSILPSIQSADVHGSFALVAQLLVTLGRVELDTESVNRRTRVRRGKWSWVSVCSLSEP